VALEWSGPLTSYNKRSIDGWAIQAHAGDTVPVTSLPQPLKFQRLTAGGHDNAEVGLANIQKVWSVDGSQMWGAGIFDEDDPAAVLLAGKVDKGLVNQISVDLYDCTVVPGEMDGRPTNLVTEWTLSSATLLADPKFHDARIALTAAPTEVAAAAASGQVVACKATGVALTFGLVTSKIQLTRESITAGAIGTPPPALAPTPTPAGDVDAEVRLRLAKAAALMSGLGR
jgi:hypothetical protein